MTIDQTMKTFHETKFSIRTTMKIMCLLLVMIAVGSVILHLLNSLFHFSGGLATIFGFALTELIPLYLLAVIFNYQDKKTKKENVKDILLGPIAKWSKIISNDFKHNWKMVLALMVGFVILQILTNEIVSVFAVMFGQDNLIVKSENTASLLAYMKHDYLILLVTTIIDPFFEELAFRFCLPDLITALFEKLHLNKRLAFSIAVIISAFIFASMHEANFNPAQIMVYMVLALFLQFIRVKTNSIVAGALVHGGGNLLVAFSILLIS